MIKDVNKIQYLQKIVLKKDETLVVICDNDISTEVLTRLYQKLCHLLSTEKVIIVRNKIDFKIIKTK